MLKRGQSQEDLDLKRLQGLSNCCVPTDCSLISSVSKLLTVHRVTVSFAYSNSKCCFYYDDDVNTDDDKSDYF